MDKTRQLLFLLDDGINIIPLPIKWHVKRQTLEEFIAPLLNMTVTLPDIPELRSTDVIDYDSFSWNLELLRNHAQVKDIPFPGIVIVTKRNIDSSSFKRARDLKLRVTNIEGDEIKNLINAQIKKEEGIAQDKLELFAELLEPIPYVGKFLKRLTTRKKRQTDIY